MSAEKLKELKDQLDLVIRMVEERKREKYDEFWDYVLKQYRRIRGLLDQENPDISKISKECSTAYGIIRNCYDNYMFKSLFGDPLAEEMSKVKRLLEALDEEEDE